MLYMLYICIYIMYICIYIYIYASEACASPCGESAYLCICMMSTYGAVRTPIKEPHVNTH